MMEDNQMQFPQEKELREVRCRLTKTQRQRLEFLAEQAGFATLSEYIRSKIFEAPTVEIKLNKILEIIGNEQDGKNGTKTRVGKTHK
jgi:hypothetical protein